MTSLCIQSCRPLCTQQPFGWAQAPPYNQQPSNKSRAAASRYTSVRKLATALFGEVWLCVDEVTKAFVAVKHCDTSDAGEFKDDPTKEAACMRTLKHENILECIDEIDLTNNVKCLVYPYCSNGDLFDSISEMDCSDTVLIAFAQLVNGLRYLHSQGYAHLDMSLENVLITEDGCLKISDFGLAEKVSELLATKKTVSNVGKTFYMAPEVKYPECQPADYDPRSADLFSLGVCLFMLTFGFQPYNSPEASDQAFTILMTKGVRSLLRAYQIEIGDRERLIPYLESLLVVHNCRTSLDEIYHRLLSEQIDERYHD